MTEFPYDTYVDKALNSDDLSKHIENQWYGPSITYFNLPEHDLRKLLTDAWMAGLKYSLVMIESEKRNRDPKKA